LDSTGFAGGLPDGEANGNVLVWNGTSWVVATDVVKIPTTGTNYFSSKTLFGGSATATYTISLNGNEDQYIALERNTATTDGKALYILAGKPKVGGTDKQGGNLILSSGDGTGTGTSSIIFKTAQAAVTGVSATIAETKITINGNGDFYPNFSQLQNLGRTSVCWDTLFVDNLVSCDTNGVNIPSFNITTLTSETTKYSYTTSIPECGPATVGQVRLIATPGEPDRMKMCINSDGAGTYLWVTIRWE
jgi:hypothetical protein